jgi:hypothetical protein
MERCQSLDRLASPERVIGFLTLSVLQAGLRADGTGGAAMIGLGITKRLQGNTAEGDADIAKGKAMDWDAAVAFRFEGIDVP